MERKTNETAVGDRVLATVRTGQYIGEIAEFYGPRAVVKILAVVSHPQQGDLHHPYNPDVPLFHERRALAFTEKTTVLVRDTEPYEGDVPDYASSLKQALEAQVERLSGELSSAETDDSYKRWARRSLELLDSLRSDYKL